MAKDTPKANATAARVGALAGRTGTAENKIDGVATVTYWNPLNVGQHWDPLSVPCCTQCLSRYQSIAAIFDDLNSQLNSRFGSIQAIFEQMQAAGLY